MIDDDRGSGADEAHHRGEVRAHGQGEQDEFLVANDTERRAREAARVQFTAAFRRVGLRQAQEGADEQRNADQCHETKHRAPSESDMNPTADDGRDGGSEGEDHHHQAHQPLRLGSVMKVSNDRTPDDRADARGHALHDAKGQQHSESGRKRAADGRQ